MQLSQQHYKPQQQITSRPFRVIGTKLNMGADFQNGVKKKGKKKMHENIIQTKHLLGNIHRIFHMCILTNPFSIQKICP